MHAILIASLAPVAKNTHGHVHSCSRGIWTAATSKSAIAVSLGTVPRAQEVRS